MKPIRCRRRILRRTRTNKPVTRAYIHSLRGSLKGKGVLRGMIQDRKREEAEREFVSKRTRRGSSSAELD
jgi:hypothetical protein